MSQAKSSNPRPITPPSHQSSGSGSEDNVLAAVAANDLEKQEKARNPESPQKPQKPQLYHVQSHTSGHDIQHVDNPYREAGDEVYDRFTARKKISIVALMSFASFLAPVSSTTVLAATPEVAATYDTTGTIINLSNAVYMVWLASTPVKSTYVLILLSYSWDSHLCSGDPWALCMDDGGRSC
jgi:hypothetical protein